MNDETHDYLWGLFTAFLVFLLGALILSDRHLTKVAKECAASGGVLVAPAGVSLSDYLCIKAEVLPESAYRK